MDILPIKKLWTYTQSIEKRKRSSSIQTILSVSESHRFSAEALADYATINKSPAITAGSFTSYHRFESIEIHKVFLLLQSLL